jgi:hypothetical protein
MRPSPALFVVALVASLAVTAAGQELPRAERLVVRAVRVAQPLRIDGVLDDALYRELPPLGEYTQVEPDAGAAATERTDTWLAFDDDHVYVSFRAWDSQMDRLVATELRRDNGNLWSGNDILVFVFDTFDDRRSTISFTSTPSAAVPTARSSTRRSTTPTGTRCGSCARGASRAGGRWKRRCRSSRCATGPAAPRCGASTRCG